MNEKPMGTLPIECGGEMGRISLQEAVLDAIEHKLMVLGQHQLHAQLKETLAPWIAGQDTSWMIGERYAAE